MAQILDSLPNDDKNRILCCYVNATSQIQIARITNIPNWYFERVVFPGQRLVFEAEPTAVLEIHSGMMASAILSDTIPCKKLALQAVEPEPSNKPEQNTSNANATPISEINNGDREEAVSSSLNIAV
ncbi:DUF1830 domain-containing protein [Waterburya agarophytonicola K14]|uniref:DUF1830 domain-containing protein n=1 Tax=Waterburya agarophytonicola KI4 TaxID=2874699 RepID=A0A964BRH8_9CYAN|nr:DUF1830 domain-containing protein [Waterburya agarophytonicola]MCC0176851.1 DUF1830 domain-containing protein [Waterburya agarophytonicola KI4]